MLNKKALAAARIASAAPTDADFEYVTMLLHGDGTNGAQNNTFIDGSTNNFTVTRNGNVTQGSLNPFGDRWSNYFDGTGDNLSVASNAAIQLSNTTAFTLELWIYPTVTPSTGGAEMLWAYNPSSPFSGYGLQFYNGDIRFWDGTAWTNWGVTASSFVGQWTHLAVTYEGSGTTRRFFRNGVQIGSAATVPSSINYTSGGLNVGSFSNSSNYFQGYISNVRLVKGTAVYTAAFTPPTAPLTAITNTSLLTCQSNRFRDNSSNNFTITRNGDVSVRPFSPFSPSAAYSTSTNGGSGYFDGTTDWLEVANNAALNFASGDFTIECWFFSAGALTSQPIILQKDWTPSGTFPQYGLTFSSGGALMGVVGNASSNEQVVTGTTVVQRSTWNHAAFTKSGSTLRLFLNGALEATATSMTMGSSTMPFVVGAGGTAGTSRPLNGYVSNLRIVKGSAVYTAAFTPPTAPLTAISNTSLLLNFTNGGIIDNAADNVLETVGNAQISTSVKKFGTGSLAFDGTGDYLVPYADIEAFTFGSGNFTIEFWVYLNSTQTSVFYDGRPVSGAGATPTIYVSSNTLYYFTNNANVITGSTLSNTTWYHIAVCKSGSSTKMFVDGTQVGSTYTDTVTYVNSAGRPIIGASGNTINQYPLNGYIDDLRITKGVARYTANFTPPTAAFPDL